MLDGRLYRAAFIPVVFAIIVVAFSLGERPRPIGTTLAPDAFDGRRALLTLRTELAAAPERPPGSLGDDLLAGRVADNLRRHGFVTRARVRSGETVDGEQRLTTIIGERAGRANKRILVIAERDATAPGSPARLTATASLLELARIFSGRATRRTLTLVSTSGGTGGLAGARDLARHLPGPVDAAIVLGDLGGRDLRRPVVVPWSEDGGMAPMRLRRTVEQAVDLEADTDPGSPRALAQLARLAVPLTLTSQGPLGAEGISAVTLQESGERGPSPGTEVSQDGLQAFGRAALRAISALDNGPDVPEGPRPYIVVQKRVLPEWAIQLIGGVLLFPALLASVDGLARVRRRGSPVLVWLRWIAAAAVPFLLAALLARLLGLVGMVPAPRGAFDPEALPIDYAALTAVGLAVVLGFVIRPAVTRLLGARSLPPAGDSPGAAAAIGVAMTALAVGIWAVNPYTALLLVPAVHLWLLATVPEVRVPRGIGLLLVLLGIAPFVLVAAYYAQQFGLHPLELAWEGVVVLGSGYAGLLGVLVWSLVLGCGVLAGVVAVRKRMAPSPGERDDGAVTTRGPLSYAGPGSLGGTESALRR